MSRCFAAFWISARISGVRLCGPTQAAERLANVHAISNLSYYKKRVGSLKLVQKYFAFLALTIRATTTNGTTCGNHSELHRGAPANKMVD
jgi:hypothetical protein